MQRLAPYACCDPAQGDPAQPCAAAFLQPCGCSSATPSMLVPQGFIWPGHLTSAAAAPSLAGQALAFDAALSFTSHCNRAWACSQHRLGVLEPQCLWRSRWHSPGLASLSAEGLPVSYALQVQASVRDCLQTQAGSCPLCEWPRCRAAYWLALDVKCLGPDVALSLERRSVPNSYCQALQGCAARLGCWACTAGPTRRTAGRRPVR